MIPDTIQVNKKVDGEVEPRHAEFIWNFPETTQESVEKYGESLTMRFIKDAITLSLQAPARKVLEAAEKGADYSSVVSAVMANHNLESKRTRGPSKTKVSPYQQMAQDLADPEKREIIMATFRKLGIGLSLDEGTESTAQVEPVEQVMVETDMVSAGVSEDSSPRRRRG